MKTIDNLSNKDYRQAEGLSSSDIKDILANPYLFKMGIKPERTAQAQARLDFGSLIHCLILTPQDLDRDFCILQKDFNLRTSKDKEEYTELLKNENRTIISKSDFEKAQKILSDFEKIDIPFNFKNGVCEKSYFSEYEGVKVKCRPDCIFEKEGIIVDLKTTRAGGATPSEFQKAVANFGYYIQASHYLNITGADSFYFLAIDIENVSVGIYELDYVSLEFGDSEIKRAIDIYKNIDSVTPILSKPSVENGISQILTLPNYVFYQNQ